MQSIAIVDSNILYAAADTDDRFHRGSVALLSRPDLALVIPAMAVAEVTYLLAARLGPHAEARFLSGLRDFDVRAPEPDDWLRIAELMRQYADFPLGGTDASVIALAERMKTDIVITLDRRHFRTVQPRHCEALRLLPE